MQKKNWFKSSCSIFIALVMFTVFLPISGIKQLSADAATTYSAVFPINNGIKIAYYQQYDPNYSGHDGVDIHSSGDDTVYAAKGGTVYSIANSCTHVDYAKTHSDLDPHYSTGGNSVVIKGEDGMFYWYFHLLKDSHKVKKGDIVAAGQPIATMGSSGQSTGKHLHFTMTTSSSYSDRIIANPSGKYNGVVNYSNGPYNPKHTCASVTAGNYYIKNQSTGTYMQAASAANEAKLSLAAKKETNAFQFNLTGSQSAGYYLATKLGTSFVVNPFSDYPVNGTTINIYKKDSSGTQLLGLDKVGSGYVIHLKNNPNLCLTANGTGIKLALRTEAANQIWLIEDTVVHACTTMTTGDYYLKNQSTNTYMQAAGASNAAKLSLAAKKETTAFQFNLTGSVSAGYYLATKLGTSYVVNPYSDTPANGTTINIYKKDSSGTQLWEFDKSGSGYIIHLKSNVNLCLTADGTGVTLKTRTGAANQIWTLETTTKTLSSISIATNANKTTYYVGDALDTTGLTIKATYSDGTSKTVTSGFTASADLSKAGTQTVTVSYKDGSVTKTTTYTITVKAIELSKISIATKPDKTTYEVGEVLNTKGLTITAVYSDGTSKTLTTGFTVSADLTEAGEQTVTVSYTEGSVTKIATFTVTVKEADAIVDLNNDGSFTVADLVIFEKWLLTDPDAELSNWQSADLCEDGRLDVFDLVLLRKMLINS